MTKLACGPDGRRYLGAVAVLFREPEAERFGQVLEEAPLRLISAAIRVELSFVIEGRKGEAGRVDLERLLQDGAFEVVSVTPQQALIAIDAFRRFGKGRHQAALNIGDCFSYALSIATGHSLLYKGDDFGRTDVRSALTA
jgi:ribonuclease VapC